MKSISELTEDGIYIKDAIDLAIEVLVLMTDNVYIANVYDSSGNKFSEDSEITTYFEIYVKES